MFVIEIHSGAQIAIVDLSSCHRLTCIYRNGMMTNTVTRLPMNVFGDCVTVNHLVFIVQLVKESVEDLCTKLGIISQSEMDEYALYAVYGTNGKVITHVQL